MQKVRVATTAHQPNTASATQLAAPLEDGTVMLSMIQALIPLGLRAVEEALQQDVAALAGRRYAHDDGHAGIARWGTPRGSIYLADQKVPITVPRVRDLQAKTELPLATYAQFQTPRGRDVGLFRKVLAGISTREYAAEAVPEAFGLDKSTVSRRHDDREWLVLLLDGKTFAEDQVVIALGITPTGEKRVLGVVQTATENKRACAAFLRELIARGFAAPKGLLVVLDGAKGFRAAVRDVCGDDVCGDDVCGDDVCGDDVAVQRCQWHKRENVLSDLPKSLHAQWRRKRHAAYAHGSAADAKRALLRLIKELAVINESAARRLEEGLDETLTLHRLGVHEDLRRSLNTTNLIESVMAQIERQTQRVDHWRNSNQKQRWVAATLLQVEHNFRRVRGVKHMALLQTALSTKLPTTAVAA